jgi:hypothetical protein
MDVHPTKNVSIGIDPYPLHFYFIEDPEKCDVDVLEILKNPRNDNL